MANELSCHLTQQGLAPSRRHRSLFPRHILPFLHSLHSFLSECPFILFLPIIKSWFNASSNLKLFLILLCGTNLSFLNAPTSLCSAPFGQCPPLLMVLLESHNFWILTVPPPLFSLLALWVMGILIAVNIWIASSSPIWPLSISFNCIINFYFTSLLFKMPEVVSLFLISIWHIYL